MESKPPMVREIEFTFYEVIEHTVKMPFADVRDHFIGLRMNETGETYEGAFKTFDDPDKIYEEIVSNTNPDEWGHLVRTGHPMRSRGWNDALDNDIENIENSVIISIVEIPANIITEDRYK